MNAEEYAAYLQSDEWRATRNACMARYRQRCQVCGCTPWRRIVDVHHLHYRNVGREKPEDLVPLCCDHHALIHNQPDGYDEKVFRRLQRECEEDNWDDPMPSHVRERQLNLRGGFEKAELQARCLQCFSDYHYDDEAPHCPHCGAGIGFGRAFGKSKEDQDADTLGFTDARAMYETKDAWTKVGDVRKKP